MYTEYISMFPEHMKVCLKVTLFPQRYQYIACTVKVPHCSIVLGFRCFPNGISRYVMYIEGIPMSLSFSLSLSLSLSLYVFYICVFLYIYIYMREKERGSELYIYIYIYIYICIYLHVHINVQLCCQRCFNVFRAHQRYINVPNA